MQLPTVYRLAAPGPRTYGSAPLPGSSRLLRNVRAVQLPSIHMGPLDEQTNQQAITEAFQRGYEEGFMAARRQQLTASMLADALPAASPIAQMPSSTASKGLPQPCPDCKDSVLRSALKGLSWRIFGMTITMLLAYFMMGGGQGGGVHWSDMLKFGSMEFVSKYVMFFLHERIWASITLFR